MGPYLVIAAGLLLLAARPVNAAGPVLANRTGAGGAAIDSSWSYPVLPYLPGSYAGRSFFHDDDHLGEDMALAQGTPIRAIGPGQVVYYAGASGYGELVAVVEHDLGNDVAFRNAYGGTVAASKLLSIYGHLRPCVARSQPSACTGLQLGDRVDARTVLGYVNDDAHNGDGAEHLHLGIRLCGAAAAQATDPGRWFPGYERQSSLGHDFAAASAVIPVLLRRVGPAAGGNPRTGRPARGELACGHHAAR